MALLHQAAAPFAVALHAVTPADVAPAVPPAAITRADTWTVTHMPAIRDATPSRPAVPKVTRTGPQRDQGPGKDRYTTYLAFTTAHDAREDWLRVGEAVSAVLLTATTLGLASSVMSDPIDRLAGAPAGHRQLTIRFGVNESAPATPSTPRRPLNEVIDRRNVLTE